MMSAPGSGPVDETRESQARDRAAVYRLVSWLLLENPDERFVGEMLGSGANSWLSSIDSLSSPIAGGLVEMRVALAARQAAGVPKLCEELAVQRTRLFRGVAPGYGPRPPYEAIYRASEVGTQGELLLRLEHLYAEAGLAVPDNRAERPDYLGLELDLMALLCSEEADSWLDSQEDAAARARDLQRRLLRDHLLHWVPQYCELILKEQGVPFYHGMARALSALLSDEARQLTRI